MASSKTPFSYSQSFTDLLNQTNTPQTPIFCTQNVDAHGLEENGEGVEENSLTREARRRWTVPEDVVLVSAWLNTSKDAIVGNEQKAGTFWKRVAAYYGASPGVKDLPKREWNTCKQRWGKINEAVLRFCGCYDHAQRQTRSGQSEDDIMEMAYTLYSQDQKASFTLEHAWRILRHDQKWCCMISQKVKSQSKRVRLDDSGAHSPISNTFSDIEEQTMERPIGVKASKAKVKKGGKATDEGKEDSVNRLESVWAIKEKDNAMRDKLSKQKILENLLMKTEPLSEMEMTLKNKLMNKLINEMSEE